MQPIILPYNNNYPKISSKAFIAPSSVVIGDVTIAEDSGVWFNVTIRGDVAPINIGSGTNIQDNAVIHVTRNGGKTHIGNNITIAHKVLIHAAKLCDNCFVGMGAIIMDGVIVEEKAWVAAGSLVTKNTVIKSGEIWAGSPAKFFRELTKEETKHISRSAKNYITHAREYLVITQ